MAEIDYSTEEWRPIPGYEGLYSASSFGRIRRDKPYRSTHVGRILRPSAAGVGYLHVVLFKPPKRYTQLVGHLVMAAFAGWPQNGEQINHIDANKTNDARSNLEYCTRQENVDHAVNNHLYGQGESHHHQGFRPKLTTEQLNQVRELFERGKSSRSIARMFGVSLHTITRIKRGLTKCYVSDVV